MIVIYVLQLEEEISEVGVPLRTLAKHFEATMQEICAWRLQMFLGASDFHRLCMSLKADDNRVECSAYMIKLAFQHVPQVLVSFR